MNANVIHTRTDLRRWVDSHGDSFLDLDILDSLVGRIADMNHPRYGTDWTEFLNGLPENLMDLIYLDPEYKP